MAKFIALMDNEGLVGERKSCTNHDCYMVVYNQLDKLRAPGQSIRISDFEADDQETCDNAGTWQQIALDQRVRRLHYLDSNISALSTQEIESMSQ